MNQEATSLSHHFWVVSGPCPLANVVLLQFRGHSMWFHSINHPGDVNLIYDYIERMLLAGGILHPLDGLLSRRFERYLASCTLDESTAELPAEFSDNLGQLTLLSMMLALLSGDLLPGRPPGPVRAWRTAADSRS